MTSLITKTTIAVLLIAALGLGSLGLVTNAKTTSNKVIADGP
jgi:hypothetical protein